MCILFCENVWILFIMSLKFVPKGPISNKSTLVQITAWCRTGDMLITWTNVEPVLQRHMVSLDLSELTMENMFCQFNACWRWEQWSCTFMKTKIFMIGLKCHCLTSKQLERHRCILNSVATEALVLEHNKSTYQYPQCWQIIVFDQFYAEILHLYEMTFQNKITFWQNSHSSLRVGVHYLGSNY